jgi:hypothetical protein
MTTQGEGTTFWPTEATPADDMSDERNRKPTLTGTGQRAAEQQHRRQAAALRENLRKRKAQERARAVTPPAAADNDHAGDATK